MRSVSQTILIAVGLCFAESEIVRADTPFGLYVGGSVGQADVRSNFVDFSEHDLGWDVFMGLRPIPLVGAELEFVDFGHPTERWPQTPPAEAFYVADTADARQKAIELSALVYAPLPSPMFDLYAKAGAARLETTGHAYFHEVCIGVPCPIIVFAPLSIDRTDTRFAYGLGAQVKIAALSVRLDYQRIGSSSDDPDLVSLGLAWRF